MRSVFMFRYLRVTVLVPLYWIKPDLRPRLARGVRLRRQERVLDVEGLACLQVRALDQRALVLEEVRIEAAVLDHAVEPGLDALGELAPFVAALHEEQPRGREVQQHAVFDAH